MATPHISELFPETLGAKSPERRSTGVMSSQMIEHAIRSNQIQAAEAITDNQIQPSSLDLRLGPKAYRVRAGFLPGTNRTVSTCLAQQGEDVIELDLTEPQVLERDHVYIVPLLESLHLPAKVGAKANPKSTTGRLDIFTRLITEYGTEFDRVPNGYRGPLYAEISPRSFSICVRAGHSLNQLRFIVGSPNGSDSNIRRLDNVNGLVYASDGSPLPATVGGGLTLSIDLDFGNTTDIVGYVARNTTSPINLDRIAHYEIDKFWKPIHRPTDGQILIEPNHFYILASRELVRVPPLAAAEMLPFDASLGEFRAHYAGFFDPGFGYGDGSVCGVRAVLEIKAHYVPFFLQHGQVVAKLMYETMREQPDRLYGYNVGSSYHNQSLTLSKHFAHSTSSQPGIKL